MAAATGTRPTNVLPASADDHEVFKSEWLGISLHRCRRCTRANWHETGQPAIDNGYVPYSGPAARNYPHRGDCPHRGAF